MKSSFVFGQKIGKWFSKHQTTIYTISGIALMVTGTVLAVKSKPEADEDIAVAEENAVEPLKVTDKVKVCWKRYVPAACAITSGTGFLLASNIKSVRVNAALLAASTMNENVIKGYKKYISSLGEEAVAKFNETFMNDRFDETPFDPDYYDKSVEVIPSEDELMLCFDAVTGRYFESNRGRIEAAVNRINKQIMKDEVATVNDFYYELGLESASGLGLLGWAFEFGDPEELCVTFGTRMGPNDKPALMMTYDVDNVR